MSFIKPFNILLLTAFILFFTLFFFDKETFDVHLYDTYFIIPIRDSIIAFAIFYIIVAILYKLLKNKLFSNFVSWLHITITIAVTIVIIFMALNNSFFSKEESIYKWNNLDRYRTFSKLLRISIIAFTFIQFVFIINIIAGLIKNKN